MNAMQWKALPEFIRHGDVVAVGLKRSVLASITMELRPEQPVEVCPSGMVAVRRLGKKRLFVKSTVSRMLPKEFKE